MTELKKSILSLFVSYLLVAGVIIVYNKMQNIHIDVFKNGVVIKKVKGIDTSYIVLGKGITVIEKDDVFVGDSVISKRSWYRPAEEPRVSGNQNIYIGNYIR